MPMLGDSKIRAFLTVLEEGSFTGAARKLGVTQPAVSAQIASLEDQLGFPLFEREPYLTLTPTGDIFVGYARRIQEAYDLANNAFTSVFSK
ncbi:MAG: LysR family transcriptional regulator [Bacteroidales bacterium]|nr:LysR family transcriptional regulator [Bacteroidales bacterium]